MRFSAIILGAFAAIATAAPTTEEQPTNAPADEAVVPVEANAKPIIPFLGAGAGLLGAGIAGAVGAGAAALTAGGIGLARGFGDRVGDRIDDFFGRGDDDRQIVYVPVQNYPPQGYNNAPPPGYYNAPPPNYNNAPQGYYGRAYRA